MNVNITNIQNQLPDKEISVVKGETNKQKKLGKGLFSSGPLFQNLPPKDNIDEIAAKYNHKEIKDQNDKTNTKVDGLEKDFKKQLLDQSKLIKELAKSLAENKGVVNSLTTRIDFLEEENNSLKGSQKKNNKKKNKKPKKKKEESESNSESSENSNKKDDESKSSNDDSDKESGNSSESESKSKKKTKREAEKKKKLKKDAKKVLKKGKIGLNFSDDESNLSAVLKKLAISKEDEVKVVKKLIEKNKKKSKSPEQKYYKKKESDKKDYTALPTAEYNQLKKKPLTITKLTNQTPERDTPLISI